jgi:hypothetical protein
MPVAADIRHARDNAYAAHKLWETAPLINPARAADAYQPHSVCFAQQFRAPPGFCNQA